MFCILAYPLCIACCQSVPGFFQSWLKACLAGRQILFLWQLKSPHFRYHNGSIAGLQYWRLQEYAALQRGKISLSLNRIPTFICMFLFLCILACVAFYNNLYSRATFSSIVVLVTLNFWSIFLRCVSTVKGLRMSLSAIWGPFNPSFSYWSFSFSRLVNTGTALMALCKEENCSSTFSLAALLR